MSSIVKDVEYQLVRWYDAIHSGDADKATLLYSPDAILLSTLGEGVKQGHPQIRQYFAAEFLPRHPKGCTEKPFTKIVGGVAVNSGIYKFELDKKDGPGRENVTARYTFVYQWIGTDWVIVEHHSSVMPGQPAPSGDRPKKKRKK